MEIKNFFENLKSNLRLKHIFGHLTEKKLLSIAKYNKYLQKRMNMDINDYINYIRIEIELFPKLISKKNYFILFFTISFTQNSCFIPKTPLRA